MFIQIFENYFFIFLAAIFISSSFLVATFFSIYVKNIPQKIKSNILTVGGGIFLATISFSLVDESVKYGDTLTLIIGFSLGAILFSIANFIIREKHGKKHKNNKSVTLAETIVVGETLDSVAEGLFIGIIISINLAHVYAALYAIFLGNLFTTIEAARTMFESGIDSKKIEVINETSEDFIFKEVSNRQDVKIVVEPPKEIPKENGAGFSVAKGTSGKAYHLNVKYYVGEEGSEDVIGFGFKSKSNTDSWNDFDCFTDTPDNIKGEYDHCNGGTTTFTFSPK